MGKIAIEFQNISKQYALGSIGTGTLSRDLNRWWARIRGKEDPYLRIGEENDRSKQAMGDFLLSHCVCSHLYDKTGRLPDQPESLEE